MAKKWRALVIVLTIIVVVLAVYIVYLFQQEKSVPDPSEPVKIESNDDILIVDEIESSPAIEEEAAASIIDDPAPAEEKSQETENNDQVKILLSADINGGWSMIDGDLIRFLYFENGTYAEYAFGYQNSEISVFYAGTYSVAHDSFIIDLTDQREADLMDPDYKKNPPMKSFQKITLEGDTMTLEYVSGDKLTPNKVCVFYRDNSFY